MAGPVLDMIPKLLNAGNEQKLKEDQQENKFITDLLAEHNRDTLLKDFIDSQAAAKGAAPDAINMNQLLQLLQQMPQHAPATAAPATSSNPPPVTPQIIPTAEKQAATAPPAIAPAAIAKSLSKHNVYRTLSTRAILSFETKQTFLANGKEQVIFNRKGNIKIKIKLNVTAPVPESALPKAITKFYFKDDSNNILFEKMFRQKDVSPNSVLEYDFTTDELHSFPTGIPVQVIAEMKWLSSQNTEVKALGSAEMVFADLYFLKQKGKELAEEKEPADMKEHRSFWNKIWESPVMDEANQANTNGVKKYHWQLQANVKYTFMLSAANESNGLMETKMLIAEGDRESLTEKFEGRMKAGVELSISELNKMNSLWDRQPVLSPEKLAALKNPYVVSGSASEFITELKLKGRAAQKGMVYIIPILKRFDFLLSKIKSSNDAGEVTEVEEEAVSIPLPVSARILGIKTK